MAEPRKEEGHIGLTSRPAATTPVVVSPLPASGGAAAPAGEREGSEESAAGTAIASEASIRTVSEDNSVNNIWVPLSIPVSDMPEINDAMERAHGYNPTPEVGENAAPTSEKRFAEATKKLSGAVPKRYGESTQVPTIYKVPDELKGGVDDHKDYSPVAVYLGGFLSTWYERRRCKLEEYKWCCVRQLIGRHGPAVDSSEAPKLLHLCMESMNRLLPQVIASYFQDIEVVDNDEMAERMLLDGCLILHRLLKYARPAAERKDDDDDDWTQTFGRCWVWQSVTRDMLLLENQIPFFVVKELFQLLKNEGESEELLFTGGLRLFRSLRLQMRDLSEIERGNVHHLLHLFYLSVGFPHKSGPYRHEPDVFLPDLTQWVPSAKELEEAGVRFRKKRNAASFLDICFNYRRGVLEIPSLQLYDSSSALFRNLIAFEQAYPATRCDVSAYAVFMDCLVNTPEDMRILHLRGILVNQMNGEQDASRFFSQICAQVRFPADNYLVGLMQEVSKYKDSRRHKWRAALVRNYFSSPWLAMSVFAAVLLLALTILQTFFTVYPYYKPSQRA